MVNNLAGSVRSDSKGNGPLADLVNSGAEIASGSSQQIKDALGRLSDALRLSQDRGAVTREQLTAIIKARAPCSTPRRRTMAHCANSAPTCGSSATSWPKRISAAAPPERDSTRY